MLNRRYLRIKVFQQLYSYFISPESGVNRNEMDLFRSLEKIYDLYLSLLCLLLEINSAAKKSSEQSKTKHLSTYSDLHPNTKFLENRIFPKIANNIYFRKHVEKRLIKWDSENDIPAKLFKFLRETPEYSAYLQNASDSFVNDKSFLTDIYKKYIFNSEELHNYFEEINIHWEEDITLANISAVKTIEQLQEGISDEESILLPLFKDEAEDSAFARDLLRKTVSMASEYEAMIAEKAENWELDRIAISDMILMKMALCELSSFENIPVKVSLNEYIEISKDYSTPQSKMFINGVLDKLVAELKTTGKIAKKGRGLVE